MQQIQQTQNNLNKCPHGFPVGTCPICSGHGGPSKDKNKPRVPGEMSYNECMAVWLKMRAAREAKIQERIDKLEAARERLIMNRIMANLDNIVSKFSKLLDKVTPSFIKTPINAAAVFLLRAVNFVSKVPLFLANTLQNAVQTVKNIYSTISNFITSTSEKLASVFGEVKNFIKAQVEKKIKKPLKTLLSLFCESDEEDGEDREKIKKLLKTILKIKKKEKDKR